ncbi:MAG: hypothetical protein ACPL68_05905, partial [Candidatus Hydrothermia bacterium]
MNLVIYQGPSEAPWDITPYVPQDSMSLLQAELGENGILKASLTLELYNHDEDEMASSAWRARLRRPGILILREGFDFCFALYYDPVKTQYDPLHRRYRLHFTSLLDGLMAYRSRETWWNVMDAGTILSSFKAFLSRYLPPSIVDCAIWHPEGMSPLQADPANPTWPHFAGFVQPASWLVGRQTQGNVNGPWTIINVLGVAKSIAQENTIFALCLAKPYGWWSTEGDYVLPVIVKADWNANTWDWDITDLYWHYESGG